MAVSLPTELTRIMGDQNTERIVTHNGLALNSNQGPPRVQIICRANHSAGSSVQEEGLSETTRRHVPHGRNSELHSC
jgi:hypothetical protein